MEPEPKARAEEPGALAGEIRELAKELHEEMIYLWYEFCKNERGKTFKSPKAKERESNRFNQWLKAAREGKAGPEARKDLLEFRNFLRRRQPKSGQIKLGPGAAPPNPFASVLGGKAEKEAEPEPEEAAELAARIDSLCEALRKKSKELWFEYMKEKWDKTFDDLKSKDETKPTPKEKEGNRFNQMLVKARQGKVKQGSTRFFELKDFLTYLEGLQKPGDLVWLSPDCVPPNPFLHLFSTTERLEVEGSRGHKTVFVQNQIPGELGRAMREAGEAFLKQIKEQQKPTKKEER